jgi:hypothetical protein
MSYVLQINGSYKVGTSMEERTSKNNKSFGRMMISPTQKESLTRSD